MSEPTQPGFPPPGTTPPPAYGAPPPAYGQQPAAGRAPNYPLVTTFDESVHMNNLWGIPLVGLWVRGFLLIPHFVVLAFVGIAVALVWLVSWIPVLLNGRYPSWGYSITGGYLRWQTRVIAYFYLLSASYPPFGFEGRHDADVRWDPNQSVPRWAGIPIIGLMVRAVALIPHMIVLWFVSIAAGFLFVFAWAPILVNGRQARLVYQIGGGYLRWVNRLSAYMLLMTGPYPPFSLED